jgi:hypothetical protein
VFRFPTCSSWYRGDNVVDKNRSGKWELYLLTWPVYVYECARCAAGGYFSFRLGDAECLSLYRILYYALTLRVWLCLGAVLRALVAWRTKEVFV